MPRGLIPARGSGTGFRQRARGVRVRIVDDADLDDAERADVHVPERGEPDDDGSWPVLSDIDLAVCLVDGRSDARSAFPSPPS